VKTNRERAIASLRELANRVESGEELGEANIEVELLFEQPPEVLYPTKITDSLYTSWPKATGYRIIVKADFPKKEDDAE
jgi:hypothetical protein